jgi:predicted AlkP superfamily phosphohydrolase/phosphomutase
LLWLLIGLVVALGTPAVAAEEGKAPRNVILFGWDGAQRDHVNECLARGELPTLKKVGEEGAYVKIDIEGTTDTKAGWTQILTGYYPQVTGVYSNGLFRDVPEGLSVFERLKKHFGPDKFAAVAVIGKSAHCGEIRAPFRKRLDESAEAKVETKPEAKPEAKAEAKTDAPAAKKRAKKPAAAKQQVGTVVEENGVKYLVFEGSPYYTMHKSCDVWDYGLVQDEKVGTRAMELLEKYKDQPFFFFVHFAEVDQKGHKGGENSQDYNDALISNDTWTGKIIAKLKELGLYDKTQVYITADHGFNEDATGHGFAPYVFLATNNKAVQRDGRRQDVTPTILDVFGLDLGKFEPPLDGISLTKADNRPAANIVPPKKKAGTAKKKAAKQKAAAVQEKQAVAQ